MPSQMNKQWSAVLSAVCVCFIAVSAGCNRQKSRRAKTAAENTDSKSQQTTTAAKPDAASNKKSKSSASGGQIQGWTEDTRERFYFLTQGSQLVPYEWFLALEQAESEDLFRSNANMKKLGFINYPKSTRNPDALPIGFVKDDNPASVTASFSMKRAFLGSDSKIENYPSTNRWLGFTCAACHTNDIHYKGEVMRIDGGAAFADLETFEIELASALRETHTKDEKFTRFAKRVAKNIGQPFDEIEAIALRKRIVAYTGALQAMIDRNHSKHRYGFARLDAFGAILNKVISTGLQIPGNSQPASAPVSYPFLWDTPRLLWVQWNSSAGVPISRNIGEVLGVFAHVKLTGTSAQGQFTSTANVRNLLDLETMIKNLKAPVWPERHLGKIDRSRAKLGKELYAANCTECHSIRGADNKFPMTPPNDNKSQFIITRSIPVFPPDKNKIGTDPTMVTNVLLRKSKTGAMKNRIEGKPDEAPAVAVLAAAVSGVVELAIKKMSKEQRLEIKGHRDANDSRPPKAVLFGYKARPLNGVWATAPFLHNGSVPNLYQLLLPAKDRVKTFYVGSREFDPVKVGFDMAKAKGMFKFDTTVRGNSNSGHEGHHYTQTAGEDGEFRDFNEQEIMALIEYMKTLE